MMEAMLGPTTLLFLKDSGLNLNAVHARSAISVKSIKWFPSNVLKGPTLT